MGVNCGEIQAIHWMYPIIGLPQALPPKNPPSKYILLRREKKSTDHQETLTIL